MPCRVSFSGASTGIYLFYQKKEELETSLAQAEKEYKRNKNLFDKKVISEEEYDKYYFQYQSRQMNWLH